MIPIVRMSFQNINKNLEFRRDIVVENNLREKMSYLFNHILSKSEDGMKFAKTETNLRVKENYIQLNSTTKKYMKEYRILLGTFKE